MAPDERINFAWVWKPATGNADEGSVTLPLGVEARSPSRDQESHNAEFLSGILLGVAAAALIAMIQEFLTNERNERAARNRRIRNLDRSS